MAKISVLDSTIKSPIDELAKNIECQVLKMLHNSTLGKIVGVYIDGGLTMFRSQSEFMAKKKKTSNGVRFHYVIHQKALSSRTFLIAM